MMTRSIVAVLTLLLSQASRAEANSYIDPGVGSFVLQMALASFFAALFVFKKWVRAFLTYIRGLLRRAT